jgi:hypothetical protein
MIGSLVIVYTPVGGAPPAGPVKRFLTLLGVG